MIEATLPAPHHTFGHPTRETVSDPAMPVASAERALYEQHVDRIFRLALRMTGNATLAEDLTQDVFLRAFDRLQQFRGDAQFSTWLHRVAVSVILNAIRKRRASEAREVDLEASAPVTGQSGAIDLDVRDRVRAAVAQLPEDLRMVVVLFDVEGYSHNEIADMMGISSGACRTRLMRARQLLRAMLPLERQEWSR
jgi:RNA polymerase sigma-70 factor (ECF subfamily)